MCYHAVVDDSSGDSGSVFSCHSKFNQSIVNQNAVANFNHLRQVLVRDGNLKKCSKE